jgi:putative spermidine/putrescine transport system substrate-binding protein
MRSTLKLLTLGLAAAFATVVSADITVTSWGGAYTNSQQKAYGEPFEKKTGIKVNWENYNGGLAEVRAQVESKNVTWDIVDVLPHEAIVGCDEGLFHELPIDEFVPAPDGTSMRNDMVVPLPNDCAVPQIFWSYAVFYDKTQFPGKKPKDIKDFFDVKKFPGKRGINSWANANIEMALVADGVKPQDVYKVASTKQGLDRAFKKLDTIKDHVVFWSAGAQPLELVKSGEVVMATAYNGRSGAAILTEGQPFEIIWDAQVLEQEYMVMINGTKKYKEALEFLKFASAPEQQAGQAKYINYGPMRKSGLTIIGNNEPFFHNGKDIMPHMPNTEQKLKISVVADPFWWADHSGEISERFTAWMAK